MGLNQRRFGPRQEPVEDGADGRIKAQQRRLSQRSTSLTVRRGPKPRKKTLNEAAAGQDKKEKKREEHSQDHVSKIL